MIFGQSKSEILKALPHKVQSFAFINILFYGEEEKGGDTIQTKPKQGTTSS